jgi:hypothetical protein
MDASRELGEHIALYCVLFLVDTFACLSTHTHTHKKTHLGFLHLLMNAFRVTSRTRVPRVIVSGLEPFRFKN